MDHMARVYWCAQAIFNWVISSANTSNKLVRVGFFFCFALPGQKSIIANGVFLLFTAIFARLNIKERTINI